MRIFPEKYRLLAWLSLILVVGFMTSSALSYITSVKALRKTLADQTLPLTGDTIYSEIQKDIIRPVFISSLMAQDTFLRDWILDGEQDKSKIQRYLQEVADKYGTVVSFLVSDLSRTYYHQSGVLKKINENEPRDAWFFRVRSMSAPYETNVDPDLANQDAMTIFVNYRVLDYDGRFIGATGVGLKVNTLNHIIGSYQTRFNRQIYFVDNTGTVVLAGRTSQQTLENSIHDRPGTHKIAGEILASGPTPTALRYSVDGDTVLLNARLIPELGWHLVVEQSESVELARIQRVFLLNIAIFLAVTALVLALVWYAINRYHRHLKHLVTTDTLTGCLNRRTFDLMLSKVLAESRRTGRPFSVLLFDLDYFKQINDRQGHAAGDEVLRQIGQLARDSLRASDTLARWGGEEFMVLLNETTLEQAERVADKLRQCIAAHDFRMKGRQQPVTISVGVAQHQQDEDANALFSRVDRALYQAKAAGRNRVKGDYRRAAEWSSIGV